MFLTYVIKVDKREVLRLYFKHICAVLFFLDFLGKLPLCRKRERFWVISIFGPSRSSQFDTFLAYVINVDNTEVLRLSFKHIHVLFVFLVFFQENYHYAVKLNNFEIIKSHISKDVQKFSFKLATGKCILKNH